MLRRTFLSYFIANVRASETPNPDCLQFRPYTPLDGVLPRGCGPVEVPYRSVSRVHPLAELIFEQYDREVRGIFLSEDYVAITKWADIRWTVELERSLCGTIGSFLMTNDCIPPDLEEIKGLDLDVGLTVDPEKDSEVLQCIKELLTKEVRPMVQRDGGDIKLMTWEEDIGVLKLKMLGACKSCPSSQNTLKEGIERMLQHFVPEVKEVSEYKTQQDDMLDAISKQRMAEKKEREGGLEEEEDPDQNQNENDDDDNSLENGEKKNTSPAAETIRLALGQQTITATASWNIKDTIKKQLEEVKEKEKLAKDNTNTNNQHQTAEEQQRLDDQERSRGFMTGFSNQTGLKKKDEEKFREAIKNTRQDATDMTVDFHATYNILGGLSAEDVEASKRRQVEIEAELEKEAKEKAERWAQARAQQRRKQKKTVGMLDDPEG